MKLVGIQLKPLDPNDDITQLKSFLKETWINWPQSPDLEIILNFGYLPFHVTDDTLPLCLQSPSETIHTAYTEPNAFS